jgi:hypothetical protein
MSVTKPHIKKLKKKTIPHVMMSDYNTNS